MSTYLILGGSGQIAREFILKNKNEENLFIIVDKKPVSSELKSLLSKNSSVKYFCIDLTSVKSYEKLLIYLSSEKKLIDYILFSVGINPMNNFFTSEIDTFNKTMFTNFNSLFISLKLVYQYMNKTCVIVIIASQNGLVGHEDRIDYGPSKAALIQFVKNLSIDFVKYSDKDIKINSISPGYISSENSERFFETIEGKKLKKRIPYNKLVGLDDVVKTIQFLFSDSSSAIRGQNLVIDYGYTIV